MVTAAARTIPKTDASLAWFWFGATRAPYWRYIDVAGL